jgi:putative DNA primase/helicase
VARLAARDPRRQADEGSLPGDRPDCEGVDDRAELPQILNWSLDGLERLGLTGRFTRPSGADEAMVALQDLASPVAALVRDRCERGPEREVAVDDLYTAWKTWAEDNGHKRSTKQVFGRDLRAAVPGLRVTRPRDGDVRERVYQGVGLRPEQASS